MLIISCHSDTGFDHHSLRKLPNGLLEGHLDNFVGVYSVMKAYFSGRMTSDQVRIELTYGEEKDFDGAYEVLETITEDDVVIVVDVTATPTTKDIVFEKCRNGRIRRFIENALEGMSYDLYEDCPDPVSDSDETDVYSEVTPYTCFLGVPVFGGDYNADAVRCSEKTPDLISEAVCRLAEAYSAGQF